MAEDLGAKPLYVVNVGLWHGGLTPVDSLQPWIDETLAALEYANGDVTTKYGALRAKNGHPAPFNLEYLEIGNENNQPDARQQSDHYYDRFKLFKEQILKKYPKIHLICNEKGELLNFMITPGDVDDRKPLDHKAFVEFLYGKLVGDKGYIGKELFQRLFVDGIQLITKLKSNMKGAVMSMSDRLLTRKRAIIETINDELKNIAQVEHSRHRSFDNFIVNMLGALAAYCFFPKKPCIACERVVDTQLALF